MRPVLICYNGASAKAKSKTHLPCRLACLPRQGGVLTIYCLIMKKEAIFAIIIGIIVGLGITFGIYKLKSKATVSVEDQLNQQNTPTPSADINQKLLITSPKDESILASTDLRVSGNAEPNELIVIFVNDKEYITKADTIGAFAMDVELEVGGNIIEYTAIDVEGKQTTVTQNVIVSTASLDEKVEASEEDATASAKTSPTATPKVTGPTKKPTATPKATATPKEDQ